MKKPHLSVLHPLGENVDTLQITEPMLRVTESLQRFDDMFAPVRRQIEMIERLERPFRNHIAELEAQYERQFGFLLRYAENLEAEQKRWIAPLQKFAADFANQYASTLNALSEAAAEHVRRRTAGPYAVNEIIASHLAVADTASRLLTNLTQTHPEAFASSTTSVVIEQSDTVPGDQLALDFIGDDILESLDRLIKESPSLKDFLNHLSNWLTIFGDKIASIKDTNTARRAAYIIFWILTALVLPHYFEKLLLEPIDSIVFSKPEADDKKTPPIGEIESHLP